jgi:hypothetical protein
MFDSPDIIVQRRMLCLRIKSLGFATYYRTFSKKWGES